MAIGATDKLYEVPAVVADNAAERATAILKELQDANLPAAVRERLQQELVDIRAQVSQIKVK